MITLSGTNTKELLARLIRDKFDQKFQFWDNQPNELIQLAKDCGLNELATEMERDL